ncbi:MAG TPA: hypothetical protein VF723_12235 [Pyrinomonadaceae bacterium]
MAEDRKVAGRGLISRRSRQRSCDCPAVDESAAPHFKPRTPSVISRRTAAHAIGRSLTDSASRFLSPWPVPHPAIGQTLAPVPAFIPNDIIEQAKALIYA